MLPPKTYNLKQKEITKVTLSPSTFAIIWREYQKKSLKPNG
jgi:hypothetical protein